MRRFIGIAVLPFILSPLVVSASTVYIDPSAGTYGVGDTFVTSIRLQSEGECINAAGVTIVYPKESLRAVDFSRGDSIFSLWVEEPKINTETGTITFSGGIPGGYCGRIQGDPSISNILGKVVFTVIGTSEEARVRFSPSTTLYLNDGAGTRSNATLNPAVFTLVSEPQLTENEWIDEVRQDTIAPDPFTIEVQSTRGVFNGRYYLVFSTVDKQSGLDHYELHEKGAWKTIKSPYELWNTAILDGIQLRAIDKAGNVRLGSYTPGTLPERQGPSDMNFLIMAAIGLVLLFGAKYYLDRKRSEEPLVMP